MICDQLNERVGGDLHAPGRQSDFARQQQSIANRKQRAGSVLVLQKNWNSALKESDTFYSMDHWWEAGVADVILFCRRRVDGKGAKILD